MDFEPVNIHPRNTNSLIVRAGKKSYAFDPWGTAAQWRDRDIDAVFLTHGHFDHMSALAGWDVPWYMSLADLPSLEWSKPFLPGDPSRAPLSFSAAPKIEGMEIIETPGHSAGGVCFYFPNNKILLSGDTIFYDSVGRWDLPTASESELLKSIALLKSLNFPDNTVVIPGHGRHGYWGDIKKSNPWLQ